MAEYALLVAIVIASVVGMQTYYKRGLQARIKGVVDEVNKGTASSTPSSTPITQYEPYYAGSTFTTTQTETDNEQYQQGGTVARTSTRGVTRSGTQTDSGGDQLTADDVWNQ